MINKIGVLGNVNQVSRPSFRAVDADTKVTNPQIEIKAPEAIASYGVAAMRMAKKFDIKPLEPIVIQPNYTHSIKGERIYTSEGRLYSIVDENENTKIVYTPNEDDERFFDRIVTTDKETGNVIRRQVNYIEDGEYDEMTVYAYSKDTGKLEAETTYNEGKLYSATKYINSRDDVEESITYNYQDKDYTWYKTSNDGDKETYMRMSKDLKFVNLKECKMTSSKEVEVEASFYNGGLISLNEENTTIVPNLLGREPLNDDDLKPAEKYNLEAIAPDFEGEKTYFSNGAVESITIPDGTAFFTPEGKVEKLVSPTKEIEVGRNGNQKIVEKLDDNTTKTTTYYEDKCINVEFENDDIYKKLGLHPNLKPWFYSEKNKKDDSELTFLYNKQGVLEDAFPF